MTAVRVLLLGGCLVFFSPVLGAADVLPHPDSDDAHCDEDQQCPKSATWCDVDSYPDDKAADKKAADDAATCRAAQKQKGLGVRCETGSRLHRRILYCSPGEKGSWRGPFFGLCSKHR